MWRAVLELLRIERAALSAEAPVDQMATPLEQAGAERDQRVAALQAVLDRLDDQPGLPDERRDAVRRLVTDRMNMLNAVDTEMLAVPESTPEHGQLGLWNAIRDVLATERRALRALGSELSADTSARLERDDANEDDELAAV
jgi:hypothetical protein